MTNMPLIPQYKEIKGQTFCDFKIIFFAIKQIPFLCRLIFCTFRRLFQFQDKEFICLSSDNVLYQLSCCMMFPTMWHVRPAKAQIRLRICAVGSEPLLVA